MKKHLAYLAVPVLALILTACGGSGNKNEVVKTTPDEILKAYQGGAKAGDAKFKGQKIEVSGEVLDTDKMDTGIPYLHFAPDTEINPVFNFKKEQAKAVAALKPGQKVTLSCIGAGEQLRTPAFKDCEIAGDKK